MNSKSIVSTHFTRAASFQPGEQPPLIEILDADRDAEAENIDMAAAVESEIFGNGTVRGLAWVQEAIRSRANFAQRLPDTNLMTIGYGPGSLSNLSPEERKRKADDESQDWFDAMIDIGERKRKEQLEREQREWDTTEHSFAGQTMTGKEWAEFAESLKEGSKGQSWLIEYLMTKQGMTQDEATQYAHDMKDAADGMATPHPTEEQEAAKHRIEANPKSDEIVHDYKVAQDQNFPPVSEKTAHLTNADQTVSVAARSTGLYEEFPTAPNLIEHHEAALAAKEPLDAAKPTQVAAAVPPPAASAGLDV